MTTIAKTWILLCCVLANTNDAIAQTNTNSAGEPNIQIRLIKTNVTNSNNLVLIAHLLVPWDCTVLHPQVTIFFNNKRAMLVHSDTFMSESHSDWRNCTFEFYTVSSRFFPDLDGVPGTPTFDRPEIWKAEKVTVQFKTAINGDPVEIKKEFIIKDLQNLPGAKGAGGRSRSKN